MADVKIDTIVDTDAAAARVTIKLPGYLHSSIGTSKKHPKDSTDPSIGEVLALARAMEAAAQDLQRVAEYWTEFNEANTKLANMPFFKEPEANAPSR